MAASDELKCSKFVKKLTARQINQACDDGEAEWSGTDSIDSGRKKVISNKG